MKYMRYILMAGFLFACISPAQAGVTVAVAPNVTMSSTTSKPVLEGLSSAANGVQKSLQNKPAYKPSPVAPPVDRTVTGPTPNPYAGKKIIYSDRSGAPPPKRTFNIE